MLNFLQNQQADEKICLFIRHSNRDRIPDGSFGDEVLLNTDGVINAINFGKKLAQINKFTIKNIIASPIMRCIQTAQNIAEGLLQTNQQRIKVREDFALAIPGMDSFDNLKLINHYCQNDIYDIYINLIRHGEIPGVVNLHNFENKTTDCILQYSQPKELSIFVTHDVNIAVYHFCRNKEILAKKDWAKFLSGLILVNDKFYNFSV